jgi:group I intron endonuclease
MRVSSIYTITNLSTGKRYVGFTSRKPSEREQCHRSGRSECKALRAAFAKHGSEVMAFEVIYQSLDCHHTLTVMEPYFIAEFGTFGTGGYNLTAGGEGTLGRKCTPEQIECIRQRARGRRRSAEAIRKQVLNSVGKKRSSETRLKQSVAQRGQLGSGFGKRGELHCQAKKYRLEKLDGTIIEFTGLTQFCRANPLYSPSMLSMMAHGKRHAYKDVGSISCWQDLPVGSFSESGTNINTTVLTAWAKKEAAE